MKKKNLLVICAASSLCLVFALLLVGGMSIYAEKSGTQEFVPEMEESEASDMLTRIIAEDSTEDIVEKDSIENTREKDSIEDTREKDNAEDTVETGSMTEGELKNIWKKLYGEYEEARKDDPSPQEDTALDAKASLDGIGINDAGLIFLAEINHLYPQDSLADLKVSDMSLESSTIPNSTVVYWVGKLENGYGAAESGYRSYLCQIDSASGKIVSFGKFQPYQKDIDYSAISWTDEKIKEHGRQLIEKYDFSQKEDLDWATVEIYSGKEEVDSLKSEFEERPDLSKSVCNTLVFEKDGFKNFYLCMDWATGEISNYLGTDSTMP